MLEVHLRQVVDQGCGRVVPHEDRREAGRDPLRGVGVVGEVVQVGLGHRPAVGAAVAGVEGAHAHRARPVGELVVAGGPGVPLVDLVAGQDPAELTSFSV